ncbi:small ribosomal subunit protein bS16m-like [Saccostrea echinata]|uniref:small ribosomal subunit protein bS16m-like n=1 Tax=Saccostrea echinata TaxID=191078 RepID=UPI002A7FFC82|nr:small ribosomal subunit protein bS16m-like [Saccostrea echinata]
MKPYPGAKLVVRMARYGCTNRPFYHIVVTWNRYPRDRKIKEQIGFYDRLPNLNGEQVLGLNLDRVRHYFKFGAEFSRPVLQLLGIVGYFPIHPYTLVEARRITRRREELEKKLIELHSEQKSDQSEEEVEKENLNIDQSNNMDSDTMPTTANQNRETLSESLSKAKKLSVLKV